MNDEPIHNWEQRTVRAMGSHAILLVGDAPFGALDWAVAELARLEACWSRFRADSELSQLNESDGRWFPMSPTLRHAVDRAFELHDVTGGLYDATILRRLVEMGYDRTFASVEPDRGIAPAPGQPSAGMTGIERDEAHIRLPAATGLDLGGIGKGLAADVIAGGLVERGARAACISVGGDLRARGATPEPEGWAIPIDDPRRPDTQWGTVALRDAAIVQSTTLIRAWRRGGRELHHLIDPRRGEPADSGIVGAIVHADDAWLAEGLAKAALIAGTEAGPVLLERAGAMGWLVAQDGSVFTTPVVPAIRQLESAA